MLGRTAASDSAIGKIVHNGLQRLQTSRRREDIDAAMEEGMMEIVPRLEKRTHYIATFANVITLVGLLGTITGLIHAFTAVSQVNPSEKAALLSASISIAMNNTAFALMVAIPFLLIHAFLQARTSDIVDGLEAAKISFLNLVQRLAPDTKAALKMKAPRLPSFTAPRAGASTPAGGRAMVLTCPSDACASLQRRWKSPRSST